VSERTGSHAEEMRELAARVRYLEAKVAFMRRHATELAEAQAALHAGFPVEQGNLAAELARLNERNRALEDSVAAIQRTLSLRVTAPLRYFRRLQLRSTRS